MKRRDLQVMKFIAVDDERLQLATIMEYVSEFYPSAEIKGFTKASEVLEYAETQTADVAILDINMPGNMSGINIGEILRKKNNRIKLLYCSGYSHYAMDAFKMHANGYLQKPIMKDDLKKELSYIMEMPVFGSQEKPYINTFGNFDIYYANRPLVFKRSKSKECLAFLTDRKGAWVSNKELTVVLWEETGNNITLSKYITMIVKDMVADLEAVGIGHIIERQRGRVRLLKNEVACDYFDYLAKDENAIALFRDEYMSQYSWGESTLGALISGKPSE